MRRNHLRLCGAICLFMALRASAGEPAADILFLGVQRSAVVDSLASQIVTEYLQEHGEPILKGPLLTDTDRHCRSPQCLTALMQQKGSNLVLSGDVNPLGSNQNLRVVVRLFDGKNHAVKENLCQDCDETKLGILLTTTAADLLGSYRRAVAEGKPIPSGPDWSALPAMRTSDPFTAPPPIGLQPPTALPPPITPPPEPVVPPPLASPPSSPPPPEVVQSPPPVWPPPAQTLPSEQTVQTAPPPKGMSRRRKAIAWTFGTLGAATLLTSIILTALDNRIAVDYTVNSSGSPCHDPQNAGKACVYSLVPLYAPGYAISGLLLGGLILTLSLPDSKTP